MTGVGCMCKGDVEDLETSRTRRKQVRKKGTGEGVLLNINVGWGGRPVEDKCRLLHGRQRLPVYPEEIVSMNGKVMAT